MDNSIEKINRHSSFGKGLENGELFFKGKVGDIVITEVNPDWHKDEDGYVRIPLQPLTDEFNKNLRRYCHNDIDMVKEMLARNNVVLERHIPMNAERLLPIPSIDDVHKIRMDMMHNEFSKEPVNVGTPGHIDHGDNINNARRSAIMRDYQPEEIEYDMDDWKARPEPSSKFVSDQRNSGKKRNKAKAKAQKKARKLTRRK